MSDPHNLILSVLNKDIHRWKNRQDKDNIMKYVATDLR